MTSSWSCIRDYLWQEKEAKLDKGKIYVLIRDIYSYMKTNNHYQDLQSHEDLETLGMYTTTANVYCGILIIAIAYRVHKKLLWNPQYRYMHKKSWL